MAYKSRFYPKNPDKYIGNVNGIICRSSWERFFCIKLDENKNVLKWNSEETIIPYYSHLDNKPHRYFVDFTVKMSDGRVKVIEVKPHCQTLPPKEPKRKTKKSAYRYTQDVKTYITNQLKWKAARKFCAARNMTFEIVTEYELKKLGMPIQTKGLK